MTLPRFLKVGKTWFVTRRCLVRKFLLRPDRETTRLLDYAIGHAARRSGVRVIAAVALSNHVHFVIHDPCANVPVFMREFCMDALALVPSAGSRHWRGPDGLAFCLTKLLTQAGDRDREGAAQRVDLLRTMLDPS